MVFSSPVFLFLFLPVTLALYFVLPARLRNIWLLFVSLVYSRLLFRRTAAESGGTP